MSDMNMNDALRALRRNRVTVRDGQSRAEINEQIREAARSDTLAAPLEEAPRKKGDSMAISDAMRRLAKGG